MKAQLAALADRVNPIVVQQVRRGLRGRSFSISFTLLLVASVIIALVGYVNYDPRHPGSAGAGLFAAFFACFALVGFVIIPFSAYRSLSNDREDRIWPLVILTRLSPTQILTGTIGSFLVQAGLYACVLGPFLLFSYLFQGIPLMGVGLVLFTSSVFLVFLVVCASAAATLADGRLSKSAVSILLLLVLLWTMAVLAPMATRFLMYPGESSFEETAKALGTTVLMLCSYGQLAFFVAVSRLMFEADNHARAPRLALLVHVVFLLGSSAAFYAWGGSSGTEVHDVFILLQVFVAGVFLSSARDGLSRRLRLRPPRFRLFGLLLPGASRGHLFFLLLLAVVALGRLAFVREFSAHLTRGAIVRDAALVSLYVSLPVMLGRGPMRAWLGSPIVLRVFSASILGLATLASVLAGAAFGSRPDDPTYNFLNPFLAYDGALAHPDRELVVMVVLLSGMVTVGAQAVLRAADREASRA